MIGENATFPEGTPEEATRHSAPKVRLATPVDDEVDRNSEPSQLLSQPSVLLTAPGKVRLDHEQVEVAVRPSLTVSARTEENDFRTWRRRHEPAARLLDQVLPGHCHGLRTVVPSATGSAANAARSKD